MYFDIDDLYSNCNGCLPVCIHLSKLLTDISKIPQLPKPAD